MDTIEKRKCFVCSDYGRIRRDYEPNGRYDTTPVVRFFKRTTECCDKYIYVHDAIQQNSDIVVDCEKKINEKLGTAFEQGVCLFCRKRLYWNIYEKGIVALLILLVFHLIGNAVNPTYPIFAQILVGFGIIFGFLFVVLLIVMGVIWYNSRNSDAVDDDRDQ